MARQDLAVELYYGGTWNAAPAYVRDPVTITRGYRDEGGDISACTADLTLDNRSTDYNPRNAASPLFGLAGRNTPVRGGFDLAVESFGGTSAAGWTPADGGQSWTHSGAALADFTEGGGLGRHLQPLKNIIRVSRIGADRRDVEQVTDASIPAVAVGASVVVGHVARYQSPSGDRYWLRMELDVGGALTAKIAKSVGGVYSDLAVRSAIPGLTYTAGQSWTFRSSVAGRRLALKFWPTGTTEPAAWTLTATDASITAAGQYGLQSWVVAGNTNTTEVRFDNYRAVDRRFYCEVASWKPNRTVDFDPVAGRGDAWTEVEAAGVLRRLGQGADVVNSPLYREILAAAPTAYWPLEDVDGADGAQSAVAGVADMAPFGYSRFTSPGTGTPVPAAGLPKFGTGGGVPGSKPVVDLTQGGVLAGSVPPGSTSGWRIEWVMVAPRDKAAARIPIRWTTTGTWSTWDFQIESTGIFATFGASPTSGASGSASRSFGIFDGRPHHYAIEAGVLSGAMFVNIYIDGTLVALYSPFVAGAFTGASPGSITAVVVNPLEEVNGTESMPVLGHVAVWNPAPAGFLSSPMAMLGWPGETAAGRFLRLCAEEGVDAVVLDAATVGDDSRAMGAQRVASFTDQLAEIARTDDGLVYEPRDFLGLVLRTGRDLQNQTAALEVDYAAGEVHPPFAPVLDDQRTRNDVTAKSTSTGVTARAVLEDGRMSVLPPPAGVGRYTTQLDVNPNNPTDVAHLASWARHKGTVDEVRFARLTVDLVDSPALIADAAAVDVGDLVAVVSLPNDVTPDDPVLLALGYTEKVGSHTRTVTFTAAPGSPYTVATAGGAPRFPARGSTVAGPLTDSAMAFALASTAANGPWTTNPTYFPQDLRVGGERVTASAIGAALADAFTRTVASGWGTPDSGPAWTTSGGSASNYSVNGSAGVHTVDSVNVTRESVADVNLAVVDVTVAGVAVSAAPTGAAIHQAVAARGTDASTYVELRVFRPTAGAPTVVIRQLVAGVETFTGFPSVSGATNTSVLSMRLQAVGSVLRGKVWITGQPEPADWLVELTGTLLDAGDVAIRSLRETGNTNAGLTATYDSVAMTNAQTVTLSARGVNGVQRAWPVGTEVDVWTPAIAPL